ncbi:MAG: transposase [Salinisphaera sp.]|jgi:transposase-like protein|nr:transposase [Salinisphaera sp.]
MSKYPSERKQAILRKMAPPQNMTVAELAVEEGISDATLYNWRKAARKEGAILPSNSAVPDKWSSADKFRTVLQTATMTQAELSAYCRKHGLYPEQIEAWKAACVAGNDRADQQTRQSRQAARANKRHIKTLESEVRRKDKALAETAALLTLSKKAEAIWGHSSEDD